MMFAPAFADIDDFLITLTAWGHLLLERALRGRNETPADPLDRLYRMTSPPKPSLALDEQIDTAWNDLEERNGATMAAGIFIPWIHMVALFQLSQDEQSVLLIALLPHLDRRYDGVLTQLSQPPSTPMPGYISAMVFDAVLGARRSALALKDGGTLRHWELIEPSPRSDTFDPGAGFRLNPVIAAYLRAEAAPQPRLDQPVAMIEPSLEVAELPLMAETRDNVQRLLALWHSPDADPRSFILLLQGQDPALQDQLCAAVLATLGLTCLRLDGRDLARMFQDGRPHAAILTLLRILCRDALLCNHALVLENSQWLVSDDDESLLRDVLHLLFTSQRYVAVVNGPLARLSALAHDFTGHTAMPAVIRLEPPDATLRLALWQTHCARHQLAVSPEILSQLAETVPFSAHQIVLAVKETASRSNLTDQPIDDVLKQAAHDLSQSHGLSVAQEVRSRHRLGDIVLPTATSQAVDDVLIYVRQRHRVIEQWGFDSVTDNPTGLCVLFHGPSGTGKTMAASIIANELGLSLYKVDLSSVLSKYIGETEKHLAQLFDQAEAMNVVLFFDEAESLFARRTETKDSHDRYANLQTGYLLQRIERYAGIVILSTNLLKNIDQAFTRRFRFIIEFSFPGPDERLRLWQKAFPATAPMDAEVNLAPLAEKLSLSGGNIKNIALAAAFQAAADSGTIGMTHIHTACEREYEKIGKVFHSGMLYVDDE